MLNRWIGIFVAACLLFSGIGPSQAAQIPHLFDGQRVEKEVDKIVDIPLFEALIIADLAYTCSSEGQYDDAIDLYLRALPVIERRVGAHTKVYSDMQDELSGCYYATGRLSEAEAAADKSVDAAEGCKYLSHYDLAICYNNAGFIKQQVRQYGQAETLYKKAIDKLHAGQPLDKVLAAMIQTNLGELCEQTGKPQAALAYYRKSMSVLRHETSKDDPIVVELRQKIARASKSVAIAQRTK